MPEDGAAPRNRSPVHPAINLEEALEVAKDVMDKEGFSYAPIGVVMDHLGYSPKSSSGLRKLAALIHFGLAEDTGSGDERRIRLSDLAKNILRARVQGVETPELLKEAALNPTIYNKLWDLWYHPGPTPSATTMRWDLEHEWEFNPTAIDTFLRDFRDTLSYAGLDGDKVEDVGTPLTSEDPDPPVTDPESERTKDLAKGDRPKSKPEERTHAHVSTGERDAEGHGGSGWTGEKPESAGGKEAYTVMLPQGVATLSTSRPLTMADLDAVAAWVDYARKVRSGGG